MQYVTLVNRSTKTLSGTWDGREYKIPPGKNSFPSAMAEKFKLQNPIKGTQDPYSLDCQYLLGIVELNDPIDPIEQSDAVELFDRKKMDSVSASATVYKTNAGGLYAHEKQSPLTPDGVFVKA
jgi:hypothetical protein